MQRQDFVFNHFPQTAETSRWPSIICYGSGSKVAQFVPEINSHLYRTLSLDRRPFCVIDMEDPILASSIRTISQLRGMLDYGDTSLPRVKAFILDVRVFALNFVTSFGARGSAMVTWRSPQHQAGLRELTDTWLERHEGGLTYWPSDRQHPNFNRLQYTTNRGYIERLMKQLFFKINSNANQNQRYKARHGAERPSLGPVGLGSSEEPIDVDNYRNRQASPPVDAHSNEPLQTGDNAPERPAEGNERPIAPNDAYDVPTSPREGISETGKRKIVVLRCSSKKRMHRALQPDSSNQSKEGIAKQSPRKRRKPNTQKSGPKPKTAARRIAMPSTSTTRTRNAPARRRPSFTYFDVNADISDYSKSPSPVISDSVTEEIGLERSVGQAVPGATAEEANNSAANGDPQTPSEAPKTFTETSAPSNAAVTRNEAKEASFCAPFAIMTAPSNEPERSESTNPPSHEPDTPAASQLRDSTVETAVIPTTEPIASIRCAHGSLLGSLRRIEPWNQWTEEILTLPIQRSIEIRRGRRFNEESLASIYEKSEPKGVKWLACMIQATGKVQRLRCTSCDKNQGAFAQCIVVGGPLFPKCGNCEWNRQGCHGLGQRHLTTRPQEASQSSTEVSTSSQIVDTGSTSLQDGEISRMEPSLILGDRQSRPVSDNLPVPDIAAIYTEELTVLPTEASAGNYHPPRAETAETASSISTPKTSAVSDVVPAAVLRTQGASLEKANHMARDPPPSGKPAATIAYKVVLSRMPNFKEVSWTPRGSFRRKTLADFVGEVPLTLTPDGKGFLFTLVGPRLHSRRTIGRGQDGLFELWKDDISVTIQSIVSHTAGSGSDLIFELTIEEWREDTAVVAEPAQDRFDF